LPGRYLRRCSSWPVAPAWVRPRCRAIASDYVEAISESPREIAIQSRSMMQVLADFGSYVDVPQSDIDEGRVYAAERDAQTAQEFPALLRVRYSARQPAATETGSAPSAPVVTVPAR
jgi:hypothetical protein